MDFPSLRKAMTPWLGTQPGGSLALQPVYRLEPEAQRPQHMQYLCNIDDLSYSPALGKNMSVVSIDTFLFFLHLIVGDMMYPVQASVEYVG